MDERGVSPKRLSGPGYRPEIIYTASAAGPQGSLIPLPRGVLQHGSRSDQPVTIAQEFALTDRWAANPSNVLGWHVTIGEDVLSIHLDWKVFGWNAFAASALYVAAEYAQPTESYDITDKMVRTHNYLFAKLLRPVWPKLPLHFPSHADVEHSGEIAHAPSGKTDAFSYGSSKMENLRQRIYDGLKRDYGIAA